MTLSYDTIISVAHRNPTRADVLAAAERLLAAEGPEALSMRRLASEVGASYQVVYSRIGGKGAVGRALHDEGFRRLAECATRVREETLAQGKDATAVLEAMGRAYLSLAVEHPRLFDVMFGVPIAEFTRDDEARAVAREGFRRTWVTASRAWLDLHHPERPPRSAVRLAWRLWTAVHGITVLHVAGHESPSGDPVAEIEAAIERNLVEPLAR